VTSPVHKYAEDVVAGRVLTGKPARWACERHFRDLETGRERGFYFDEQKAAEFLRFARTNRRRRSFCASLACRSEYVGWSS
jgi:phage terminase large subunit-like protein